MSEVNPKTQAYLFAAEKIGKLKAPKWMSGDAKYKKEVNAELKAIAKRLDQSACKIAGNIYLKKRCEEDPEVGKKIKINNLLLKWVRATATKEKSEKQISEMRKENEPCRM